MLIVIEGTDRTGKSTLAANIKDRVIGSSCEVWHRSKPTEHPLTEYEQTLDNYNPLSLTQNLVIDRWHWGERVWPFVFERATEFDHAMFAHVEMFLRSRGAVMVYAQRHNISRQLADLINNDEPIKEMDDVQLAYDLFTAAHRDAACPVYTYDFEINDNPVPIIDLAAIKQREVAAAHAVTSEWIGDPYPRVLLVGETFGPSQTGRGHASVPFVPFRGTSGHFLFEQLVKLSWWKRVAIVNALDPTDRIYPLGKLWDAMGRPKVIALGRKASGTLTAQYIPHDDVPHPQYVRRFERSKGPDYYAELLASAAAS